MYVGESDEETLSSSDVDVVDDDDISDGELMMRGEGVEVQGPPLHDEDDDDDDNF